MNSFKKILFIICCIYLSPCFSNTCSNSQAATSLCLNPTSVNASSQSVIFVGDVYTYNNDYDQGTVSVPTNPCSSGRVSIMCAPKQANTTGYYTQSSYIDDHDIRTFNIFSTFTAPSTLNVSSTTTHVKTNAGDPQNRGMNYVSCVVVCFQ